MPLARVYSRAQTGIDAPPVTVEVHISNGLPALTIVGLPEAAVRESKDRVRSALLNANFDFPARRITINLAPADLPKEGGRFDLAIALGILAASSQLPLEALKTHEFLGELSLSGEVRSVRGTLPSAVQARAAHRTLVVSAANADEAALVHGAAVIGVDHLLTVCAHLSGEAPLHPHATTARVRAPRYPDLSDVRGQQQAKRALEVAAAGAHSLLFVGPPGTGKSMLASRLPGILPPMTENEALESAAVASISNAGFDATRWGQRPFRTPHHTASGVALVGGGAQPRPGEISLAHRGVMFLDELPEFDRRVLEVLREPLESGSITISRAARQAEFPAHFQLIAAMNPCPCGHLGDEDGRCRCTPHQVQRYRQRISGPLLDRIDLHCTVPRPPKSALRPGTAPDGEASAVVARRVGEARARQLARAARPNAALDNPLIQRHCRLGSSAQQLLDAAMDRLQLSARAYHRILKVARTIADLANDSSIAAPHVAEAIGFRALDRQDAD